MGDTRYLKTFFRETKKVDQDEMFEVEVEGEVNIMTYGVVLEALFTAPAIEQWNAANIIRKIDFLDGDICHFLRYLASCMAQVRLDRLAGRA